MSRSNTPKNKPGSAGGTRGKPGTPGSRRGTPKGGKRSGKLSQEEEERLREARVTEELRRLKVIEDKKRMGKTLLVQKWKALIVPTLYFWKYKGDNDLLKLLNDPIAKDAWAICSGTSTSSYSSLTNYHLKVNYRSNEPRQPKPQSPFWRLHSCQQPQRCRGL